MRLKAKNTVSNIFRIASSIHQTQSADSLLSLAQKAEIYRRFELIESLLPRMQALARGNRQRLQGEYFGAILKVYKSGSDLSAGLAELERLSCCADPDLQARCLLWLGTSFFKNRDTASALALYHEAEKFLNNNLLNFAHLRQMTAITLSQTGDHKRALVIFEATVRLLYDARRACPLLYLDAVNSLSLELAHAGRFDEARAAARFAASSSAVRVYPEIARTPFEVEQIIQGARCSKGKVISIETPREHWNAEERRWLAWKITSAVIPKPGKIIAANRLHLASDILSAPYVSEKTVKAATVLVDGDRRESEAHRRARGLRLIKT